MMITTIIRSSLSSLRANLLRSTLAMLGIIIGVAAVVAMLAIGAGVQDKILGQISAMGTDLLIVRPGQRGSGGVVSGTQQNLTIEDAQSLVALPDIVGVSPVVGGSAQVKFLNRNSRVQVQGIAVPYLSMRSFTVEQGRALSEAECEGGARVALLGPTTATNLFDEGDAVDETIKLNGINFRVVGVLKAKGDQGFFNPDDQVLIPYTTAMKTVFGISRLREIDLQVAAGTDSDKAQTAVVNHLRKRHRLAPDAEDDVRVQNQAQMLELMSSMAQTLTLFLGSIAGISLIVGGIGIMNIMLVTVTERTREIGVRKAIGARDRDILRQFLIEAVVVSVLGGMIGVALGAAVALGISMSGIISAKVELFSILLSISFAGGIGIFFGWYPARRAARMDPIEALRYE